MHIHTQPSIPKENNKTGQLFLTYSSANIIHKIVKLILKSSSRDDIQFGTTDFHGT